MHHNKDSMEAAVEEEEVVIIVRRVNSGLKVDVTQDSHVDFDTMDRADHKAEDSSSSSREEGSKDGEITAEAAAVEAAVV